VPNPDSYRDGTSHTRNTLPASRKSEMMKHLTFFIIVVLTLISCKEYSPRKKAENIKENTLKAIEAKEFPSAINSAREALEIYIHIADTIGIIESNYLMARASALSGDFDNAVLFGMNGSNLCKIIENYPLEYKLNNTLSWSYFALGKGFDETIEHQKRQMFVVKQLDDDNAKAMVYNNYGYDATVSGTVPLTDVIEYMEFANDHYAKTEKTNGRWYTLMNLTWQHRLINDLPKSAEYGRMAVEQAEIDNDRHAIIEASTNLGETLLAQKKIEEAKPFYDNGLKLSKQKDDRDKYVFDIYYSRYLWEIGKKEKAISSLKIAVDFLENSEIFYEMLGRAFLADYCFSTGNIDKAEELVKKFNNPRATYFSQESEVIACAIEAQIAAITNRETALNILDNKARELEKSGAELLKIRLLELRDQY